MCGIACYLGSENGTDRILHCLKLLLSRGFDSAGIASVNEHGTLVIQKCASTATELAVDKLLRTATEEHCPGNLLLGHTRWSTSSASTDRNAHPLTDTRKMIAMVHNGIIDNAVELRNSLIREHGIAFESDTDSEVIPHLLSIEYAKLQGENATPERRMIQAILKTTESLQGSWALGIIHTDSPAELFVCRNGSPLIAAIDNQNGIVMACSEPTVLLRYFDHYINFADGDIVKFSLSGHSIRMTTESQYKSGYISPFARPICVIEENYQDYLQISPDPYQHWTLKEIMDQSFVLHELLRLYVDTASRRLRFSQWLSRDAILTRKHVTLVGCGSSYHAAMLGCRALKRTGQFMTVEAISASEFCQDTDLPNSNLHGEDLLLIVLSQSGNTHETLSVVDCTKRRYKQAFVLGITNVKDSELVRSADKILFLHAGREIGLSCTKFFTAEVFLLDLFSRWLLVPAEQHDIKSTDEPTLGTRTVRDLTCLPSLMKQFTQQMRTVCNALAIKVLSRLKLSGTNSIAVLGIDELMPYTIESALKIKEMAYIHAEAFHAGSLRHGPLALIHTHTPCIFLCPSLAGMKSSFSRVAEEVKVRGGFNVVVCAAQVQDETRVFNGSFDVCIDLSDYVTTEDGHLRNLFAVVPMQMLAYFLSLHSGNNPDFPRNITRNNKSNSNATVKEK